MTRKKTLRELVPDLVTGINRKRKTSTRVLATLIAGRDMIESYSNWCRGTLAQNSRGRGIYPSQACIKTGAVCKVCSIGALEAIQNASKPRPHGSRSVSGYTIQTLNLMASTIPYHGADIVQLNDSTINVKNSQEAHKRVLWVWNKAVEYQTLKVKGGSSHTLKQFVKQTEKEAELLYG